MSAEYIIPRYVLSCCQKHLAPAESKDKITVLGESKHAIITAVLNDIGIHVSQIGKHSLDSLDRAKTCLDTLNSYFQKYWKHGSPCTEPRTRLGLIPEAL